MNKRSKTPTLTQEQIDYAKSQPTYLDMGYNKQLIKKEVVEEQKRADKALIEEENEMILQSHEAKIASLTKQLKNQNSKWCNYDYGSKTFQIFQNNGQLLALTFRLHDGKVSNQTILFEIGYESWEKGTVQIPRSEIIILCKSKAKKYNHYEEIDSNWLKQTRRNLKDNINQSQLLGLIESFEIEKSKSGYYKFSIKRPQNK